MTHDSALLSAVAIRRIADDGTPLLTDVDVHFPPGTSTAILGPPGSGKTLLLRALALLDPLQGGEIRFRGRPVSDHDVPSVRRRVLLIQQRPVMVEGTVRVNLRLPFTLGEASSDEFDQPRLESCLQAVGRDRFFLDRDVRDLSGGESQLVALLRAIQLDPLMLLLDEPTSSLDAATTEAAERLIKNWKAADEKRATVVVTHRTEQASRLAHRAILLERGTVVETAENAFEPA